MKSYYQHDDCAGRGIGIQELTPTGQPGLRIRKKRVLFQRNLTERLPRAEVNDGLLDRAFRTEAKGCDPDRYCRWQPEKHRVAHVVQKHVTSRIEREIY